MRLLLDTHEWLWMHTAPERLSRGARMLIEDPANELVLSLVSCWEIAIKYALGKLPLPSAPGEFVALALGIEPVELLPITLPHALRVATLPHHHRDPFDRLLVAQALIEGIPIVTADLRLAAYGIETIPAR